MKNAVLATGVISSVAIAEKGPAPIKVEDVNVNVDDVKAEKERNDNEFHMNDQDRNGFLNHEELIKAFALAENHDLVEADQKEFFEKMDEDFDGRISIDEYRDPMRAFTVLLRKQFEHLDLGNDGSLEEQELAVVGQESSIDTCDANGDGKISLTEFIEGTLRTMFPTDFVQGNPSEIGVDLDGQPLPKVRLVPPPPGQRYAAAIVARDAHIYDPYIKFQDMKRMQGTLQGVMGDMGDMMKEAGVDMNNVPGAEDMNILQALTSQFGTGDMPALGEPKKSLQEMMADIDKNFDHGQVAEDSRKFFGRPSLREMMLERESGAGRHLEL